MFQIQHQHQVKGSKLTPGQIELPIALSTRAMSTVSCPIQASTSSASLLLCWYLLLVQHHPNPRYWIIASLLYLTFRQQLWSEVFLLPPTILPDASAAALWPYRSSTIKSIQVTLKLDYHVLYVEMALKMAASLECSSSTNEPVGCKNFTIHIYKYVQFAGFYL